MEKLTQNIVGIQSVRKLLTLLFSQTLHNPTHARKLVLYLANDTIINLIALGNDLLPQIGPVLTILKISHIPHAEYLNYIFPNFFGRSGSQRQDGHVRHNHPADVGQLLVVGPEVVAPTRDHVALVDDDAVDLDVGHHRADGVAGFQHLGRHEEHLHGAGIEGRDDLGLVALQPEDGVAWFPVSAGFVFVQPGVDLLA